MTGGHAAEYGIMKNPSEVQASEGFSGHAVFFLRFPIGPSALLSEDFLHKVENDIVSVWNRWYNVVNSFVLKAADGGFSKAQQLVLSNYG